MPGLFRHRKTILIGSEDFCLHGEFIKGVYFVRSLNPDGLSHLASFIFRIKPDLYFTGITGRNDF